MKELLEDLAKLKRYYVSGQSDSEWGSTFEEEDKDGDYILAEDLDNLLEKYKDLF